MRLLFDEGLNNDLVRGLVARDPELDVVRAQDFIQGCPDDYVLEWAFYNQRVLLTHDIKSMPRHCQTRWNNRQSIAGIVFVEQIISIGPAIEQILTLLSDTEQFDWIDRTEYVTRGSVSAA